MRICRCFAGVEREGRGRGEREKGSGERLYSKFSLGRKERGGRGRAERGIRGGGTSCTGRKVAHPQVTHLATFTRTHSRTRTRPHSQMIPELTLCRTVCLLSLLDHTKSQREGRLSVKFESGGFSRSPGVFSLRAVGSETRFATQ